MSCDFDSVIDRRNTSSLKWELYKDREILPMCRCQVAPDPDSPLTPE